MVYIDDIRDVFQLRGEVTREEKAPRCAFVMDIVSLKPKSGRLEDALPPGIPKLCLLERL